MFSLDKSGRRYVPIPYVRLSIGLLEVDVIFLLPGVWLVVDDNGMTSTPKRVLMLAALMQNLQVLTYLVESGADVSLCTTGVTTISTVHVAAFVGNTEMK